tara:strand:+ start:2198 stop:2404 length:207 start_codon:yes stop_codon:yes gene_type:complete
MRTKQEIHDKIKQIECELKYQDGANLYWQRGQLDSLHWMLMGGDPSKDRYPTLEEMEAEDPDIFKNPQ